MARLDHSSVPFLLDGISRTDVELEISKTSYARGQSAMTIYGTPYDSVTSSGAGTSAAISMPSIHSNFRIIDDFSNYVLGTHTAKDGGWVNDSKKIGGATFGLAFNIAQNFSDKLGLSMWAQSDYKVCLYVSYQDSLGYTSDKISLGFLPKRWKRMDCQITWTKITAAMAAKGQKDFNPASVKKILFYVDCEVNAVYRLDEIVAFDMREEQTNKTWIRLLITDTNTKKEGRVPVSELAGYYGDIIHQDKAFSLRGNMSFRTGHQDMDMGVRFIDGARRHTTKLFLRLGGEGWPIRITNYKQKPKESIYGIRNEIDAEFVEAE